MLHTRRGEWLGTDIQSALSGYCESVRTGLPAMLVERIASKQAPTVECLTSMAHSTCLT